MSQPTNLAQTTSPKPNCCSDMISFSAKLIIWAAAAWPVYWGCLLSLYQLHLLQLPFLMQCIAIAFDFCCTAFCTAFCIALHCVVLCCICIALCCKLPACRAFEFSACLWCIPTSIHCTKHTLVGRWVEKSSDCLFLTFVLRLHVLCEKFPVAEKNTQAEWWST